MNKKAVVIIAILLLMVGLSGCTETASRLGLHDFHVEVYSSNDVVVTCEISIHPPDDNCTFNSATGTIYIYDLVEKRYKECGFGRVDATEYGESYRDINLVRGMSRVSITSQDTPQRLIILHDTDFNENTWSSIQLGLAKWKVEVTVQIYDKEGTLISLGIMFERTGNERQ